MISEIRAKVIKLFNMKYLGKLFNDDFSIAETKRSETLNDEFEKL
jgi:hypothetical protein